MKFSSYGWRLSVWLTAFSVGGILCLPNLLIPRLRHFYQSRFPEVAASWELDGRFSSVPPFDDTDSNEYAGRAHEAGRVWLPLDPYIKENKSPRLAVTDILTFDFMGLMVRFTGDISRAWLACRFFGCVFWVICVYALVFEIGRNRSWALASAVFITLALDLLDGFILSKGWVSALKDLFLHVFYFFGNYAYNFGASRLGNPALTFLPLFLTTVFAARAAEKPSRFVIVTGGLLSGTLAYVHADVWTTYIVGMFLFAALWSLAKGRIQSRLLMFYALSLIVALPWFRYNFPPDPDLVARAGVTFSRTPDLLGLVWIGGLGLIWILRRHQPMALLAGCWMGAAGLLTETQCLTGYNVQPQHWHFVAVAFAFIAGAGLLGLRLPERRDWLWATVVLAVWGLGRSIGFASLRFPFQALPKDIEAAVDYLNKNTPADSVVACLGPMENLLLPSYTRNKVLIGYGFILASDLKTEALIRRQKRTLELLDISERTLVNKIQERDFLELQQQWNKDLWKGRINWESREWASIWNYSHTMEPGRFVQLLKEQGPDRSAEVDYLWVGPFERDLMSPGALRRLGQPLYRNKTIQIFKA